MPVIATLFNPKAVKVDRTRPDSKQYRFTHPIARAVGLGYDFIGKALAEEGRNS